MDTSDPGTDFAVAEDVRQVRFRPEYYVVDFRLLGRTNAGASEEIWLNFLSNPCRHRG